MMRLLHVPFPPLPRGPHDSAGFPRAAAPPLGHGKLRENRHGQCWMLGSCCIFCPVVNLFIRRRCPVLFRFVRVPMAFNGSDLWTFLRGSEGHSLAGKGTANWNGASFSWSMTAWWWTPHDAIISGICFAALRIQAPNCFATILFRATPQRELTSAGYSRLVRS